MFTRYAFNCQEHIIIICISQSSLTILYNIFLYPIIIIVFYRYKRAKIFDAYKSGDNSKDTIIRLTQCTPGLEGYNAAVETYTSTQLMELSRGSVRVALLDNLAPKDNSKRTHRKSHGNSTMSFLEMNKIMVTAWKSLDDTSRR